MTIESPENFTDNPYISRIFLKRSANANGRGGNVLVVETNLDVKTRDEHLDDVLMDLGEIRNAARQKVGRFERIDIRFV